MSQEDRATTPRELLSKLDYALRMLVQLKDGPRDMAYGRDKELAWQLAREAVRAVDVFRGDAHETEGSTHDAPGTVRRIDGGPAMSEAADRLRATIARLKEQQLSLQRVPDEDIYPVGTVIRLTGFYHVEPATPIAYIFLKTSAGEGGVYHWRYAGIRRIGKFDHAVVTWEQILNWIADHVSVATWEILVPEAAGPDTFAVYLPRDTPAGIYGTVAHTAHLRRLDAY